MGEPLQVMLWGVFQSWIVSHMKCPSQEYRMAKFFFHLVDGERSLSSSLTPLEWAE